MTNKKRPTRKLKKPTKLTLLKSLPADDSLRLFARRWVETRPPNIGFLQRGNHRWACNVEDLRAYRNSGFVAVGREGSTMVAHLPKHESW